MIYTHSLMLWTIDHGPWIKKSKSVSRVLYPDCSGPLSFIWSHPLGFDQAVYPSRRPSGLTRRSGASRSDLDLFDLSTRKVYRAYSLAGIPVSSYLTFSPFPRPIAIGTLGSLFSVALSVPGPLRVGAFLLGSTLPCVARTFLPPIIQEAIRQLAL